MHEDVGVQPVDVGRAHFGHGGDHDGAVEAHLFATGLSSVLNSRWLA